MRNRFLTGIAVIVLLSTLSFSYGQESIPAVGITLDQQVTTATLAGRVLDNVGNPISGVLVDCVGPDGKTGFVTGVDGAYRFNLARNGHYEIQPHTEGFGKPADFDVIVPGADFRPSVR